MGDKQLTIRLLGAIEIELAGKPITGLGTRKAEALLAYLVCHKRPFSREQLADILWDDRSQTQALANLRSLLSGMRRQIKPWLIVTRHTVAFNHESDYWLDTAEFSQELAGNSGSSETTLDAPRADYAQAIALYRGDFLEGFYLRDCLGFEEWAALERERWRRLAINALYQLANDCLHNGRYPQGIQYTDQLLRLDNLSEQAHCLQMEMLARNGHRHAALQQYADCCRILADELNIEPTLATQALYQRLRNLSFPRPDNLPSDPTLFLGRQQALEEIHQHLLSADTRLLTIVGSGGIGKTRLSIRVARHIRQERPGRFLDGIFFIPLAASQTADMPFRIAEAIGLSFQNAPSPRQQVLAHLQEKEMLLVLDNLEHLLDSGHDNASTFLAEILNEAHDVTILATSRERLNLYEERLFAVSGLAVPTLDALHPEQYSAVALFLQRVGQLKHGFSPSTEELTAVINVCQLLEGVPLAVELAAGWALQHTCQMIAAETAASLDFLQTTYHNVPSRQRSLRAVFNHSWTLLTPELQTIFADLAIFPDTFEMEAAETITGATVADLAALIDKSLLQQQANGRYHIHPLLQQFIAEKLQDTGEIVRQGHTAYYLDFIERQGNGESVAERTTIRAELPNIHAVWGQAVRHQDYTTLDRAIPTVHNFFSAQSWFQEGIDFFQLALSLLTKTLVPDTISTAQAQTLCELLGRKARMHIHIGQFPEASAALAEAMPYLRHVDDADRRATIFSYLAMSHYYAGDYAQAINLAHESLRLSLQTDNLDGISFAYNFLGSCAKAHGEYEQASTYFEQAVKAYRHLEDGIGAGISLHNLGNLAQAMNDYEAAQAYYQGSTDLFKANDYKQGTSTALSNAGRLAFKQENYALARQLLSESLALKQDLNDERGMAVSLTGMAAVSIATGAYGEAQTQLRQALTLAQKCNDVKLLLEVLVETAALAIAEGREIEAAFLLAYVLAHNGTVQEIREQAENLTAKIEHFSAQNFPATELQAPIDQVVAQMGLIIVENS
jgi:DNA-binding SARP family transcriptional activator/predicted ATPase